MMRGLGVRLMVHGSGLVLCVVVGFVPGAAAQAAQDAPKPEQTSIHTLHVYTNLIQVPTLVLSPSHMPMPPIAANRFMVSVDSGPRFRATHVRQEGDDPISLSIVLDTTGPPDDILRKIDEAIGGLAPLSLHARDHVSIYALDCSLTRSLNDAPASSDSLERAVDAALQESIARKEMKHGQACKPTVHLWDAMAFAVGELYKLPGRRVMLAVTDGSDRGSKATWNELRVMAQSAGVAVFGLAYIPYPLSPFRNGNRLYENEWNSVCESSGGMVVTTDKSDAGPALKKIVSTIRERYIVEFPRPSNSTAGYHSLLVTIDKTTAFIRPAGVSMPIADPALLADPTTVPSDPSLAPVEGTRHVLKEPK